jgi:hypothetical protein
VTSSLWFFGSLINFSTPLIIGSPIGTQGFLYIVAGVNLFSIFLIALALPETKVIAVCNTILYNLYTSVRPVGKD